jgi:hypothetical protein
MIGSCLGLSDPYCPSWERTTNVFHLLNRIYVRSVTPRRRRRPWGDLVVPTVWRQWGRSMDFPSFYHISLKRLKRYSASSYSQGPTWSSSLGIPHEGSLGEPPTPTIAHVRSILDLTNCASYLLYLFDSPSFWTYLWEGNNNQKRLLIRHRLRSKRRNLPNEGLASD